MKYAPSTTNRNAVETAVLGDIHTYIYTYIHTYTHTHTHTHTHLQYTHLSRGGSTVTTLRDCIIVPGLTLEHLTISLH